MSDLKKLKLVVGGMDPREMTNTPESESAYDPCPKCGGNRWFELDILGAKKIVPVMCACKQEKYEERQQLEKQKEQQYRLDRLKQHSLMDTHFEQCTFERFEVDQHNEKLFRLAQNYCDRWLEMKKKNMGFLLWGPPGTGKSHLTFCIANRLLQSMVPVIVISSIGILNRIKQTYNSFGKDGEAEIINSLRNASLLILDDIGAENQGDRGWAKEKLYEIIDNRYRDGKPMICTTNLTREQLKNKLAGDDGVTRTYDRLIEMCYPIEVAGPSRRINAASEKTMIIKDLLGG